MILFNLLAGIDRKYIKYLTLVSASTGYGIENLITILHREWGTRGDVYIVGCTNVGKSTIFNALLGSDFCKVILKMYLLVTYLILLLFYLYSSIKLSI